AQVVALARGARQEERVEAADARDRIEQRDGDARPENRRDRAGRDGHRELARVQVDAAALGGDRARFAAGGQGLDELVRNPDHAPALPWATATSSQLSTFASSSSWSTGFIT